MRPMSSLFRSTSIALILSLGLTGLAIPVAQASLVGTQAALAMQTAASDRQRLTGLLERAEVRQGLLARGVDHRQVEARVASLSDAEVQQLTAQLDTVPAGAGGLELVLLVFILLLVTDLAGITHIFRR